MLDRKKALKGLNGKTILITGATFGIGEALVRCLLHYDVQLILVARTTEKLLALKNESSAFAANVITFTCDFYNEESINGLCVNLRPFHIDCFVSNAGKSMMRSFEDSKDRFHDYRRTIAVNYLAPVQLISMLTDRFKESRTHIINVSTYSVLMKTPPKWSAYISSKKAMHSWFESNRPELALMNITVSNIFLPLVESRMKDANENYKNMPAMSMDRAVSIIANAILRRGYSFKPWWHLPFQVALLLVSPLWNGFWYRMLRNKKC